MEALRRAGHVALGLNAAELALELELKGEYGSEIEESERGDVGPS